MCPVLECLSGNYKLMKMFWVNTRLKRFYVYFDSSCSPAGSASDQQFPINSLILAQWRLLVGNTQVAIYSMKHQSRPKYIIYIIIAAEMTMDPSRSSEEGPLWASGGWRGARAFYCVIRNIWTILKRSDGQRRWNVISSHSWPEKKRLRCWCQRAETAAAIQPRAALCAAQGAAESRARPGPALRNQATCCQQAAHAFQTWFAPWFSHWILFQPCSRKRKWYFLSLFFPPPFDLTTLIWLIT